MLIEIQCPECGRRYQVDQSRLRHKARCDFCGRGFRTQSVPETSGEGEQSSVEANPPATEPGSLESPEPNAPPAGMPAEGGPADGQPRSPAVPPRLPAGARPAPGPASSPPPIPPSQAAADDLPERIGRFKIHRRLGAGAFAVVYQAHDPALDREVALKVPRASVSSSLEARARFLREPKAAARLRHPHIVAVHDAGFDGEQYYIASDYIEGQTLAGVIEEDRPDFHRAAEIVRSLAEALDYAHRQGIVHRDVKPANVMVDAGGNALLMDFGLARIEASEEQLTQDGAVMGTAAYMAPEQADRSFGAVGPASDQYSLGVMLYEMLCGNPPFSGPSSVVIFNLLHEEPATPRSVNPAVPRDLETISRKAMAKRPQDRYADCGALAEDLRRWLAGEPIQARPIGPLERFGRWCQRNPLLATLAMTAVLLLVAVATVTTVAFWRERDLKDQLAGKIEALEGAYGDIQELETRKQELEQETSRLGKIKAWDFIREKLEEALRREGVELERPSAADAGGSGRPHRRDFEPPDETRDHRLTPHRPAQEADPGTRPAKDDSEQAPQREDDAAQRGAAAPAPVPKPPQPPPRNPFGSSVRTQAFPGQPFGVGKVTVTYAVSGPVWHPDQPLWLDEDQTRAFYPAFETSVSPTGRLHEVTAFFLFRGEEPLALRVTAARAPAVYGNAIPDPKGDRWAHQALLSAWWEHYTKPLDDVYQEYARPRLVRACLTGMLRRRLNLPSPQRGLLAEATRGLDGWPAYLFGLSGTDWYRRAMQLGAFAGPVVGGEADQPLPRAVEAPPLLIPEVPPDTRVEPLAMHVPEECFYARFANFSDFPWFCSALGGLTDNLSTRVSMRGLDHGTQARLVRQLGFGDMMAQSLSLGLLSRSLLEDSAGKGASHPTPAAADRLIGPAFVDALIDEVAVIGTDPFFGQGAAVGVIFRPSDDPERKKMLLGLIRLLRQVVDHDDPQVEEALVEVDGHAVSLLSAPDHSVRSFYAVDGDYHLVTTSRHIVKRFFEAGRGIDSLGQSKELRHARNEVPLARGDAVFVYLSTSFFRELIGPKCLIETLRRQHALADLESVRVARLAASAEGAPSGSVEELIAAGLLPASIGLRADGSHPILEAGEVKDSLRGAAGTFLPIADVPMEFVTAEEARLAEDARRLSELIFPVVIAARRDPGANPDSERIALDVFVTPFSMERFSSVRTARSELERSLPQLAGFLSQPRKDRLTWVDGDLAAFQVGLPTESWVVFGGLRKLPVSCVIQNGTVAPANFLPALEDVAGYVGESRGGLLMLLVGTVGGTSGYDPADEEGYAESKHRPAASGPDFFRWMRVWNKSWIALAPEKEILRAVTPELKVQKAERPAQLRFRLAGLSQSDVGRLLRAYDYIHARRTSAANVQLLHEVVEQLHVPPQEARRVAEGLLGATLECPLGGTYRLVRPKSSASYWTGTAWLWPSLYEETEVDPQYRSALVDRFREMVIELRLTERTLAAHVEIEVPCEGAMGSSPALVGARGKAGQAGHGTRRSALINRQLSDDPAELAASRLERVKKLQPGSVKLANLRAIIEQSPDTPQAEEAERLLLETAERIAASAIEEAGKDPPSLKQLSRYRALLSEAPETQLVLKAREQVHRQIAMGGLKEIAKLPSEGDRLRLLTLFLEEEPHFKAVDDQAKGLLLETADQIATSAIEEAGKDPLNLGQLERYHELLSEAPETQLVLKAREQVLKALDEIRRRQAEINEELAAERLKEAREANSLALKVKRLFLLICDLPATESAKEAERMIDDILLRAGSLPDRVDTVEELRELAKELPDARLREKATRLANEITAAHKLESADRWLEGSGKSGLSHVMQEKYKNRAISYYQGIIKDYPGTSSVKTAQQRLNEISP